MAGGVATLARAQRSALAVLAIRVLGAAIAYGVQVLLARLLGRAEYGIYAAVWIWVAILGHGALWGVGQSVYRFVPHHRASGEPDLARGFLAGGALFVLASALLVAALGGVLLWLGGDRLGAAYTAPLVVALLVLPLFALQDYAEGVARAFHWTALAIAPPYLLRPALIVLAMVGLIAAGAPADPAVAMIAFAVAAAASLAVQATMLLARLRRELPAGSRAYRPRLWAAASLPIALVDLTTLGLSYVDVLILSLFLPPEAVGLYFAATRILQFVAFVPYAASAATAGRFAEARAMGDDATLRALVRQAVRLTTLATLTAGAGVLAVSPLLLAMFGSGFQGGVGLLAILVAGVALQAAFGPGEDVLTMLGAERVCAAVSLAALALAAALNLALIPILGPTGAALAMAGAGVARALGLAIAARRRLGIATHVLAGR
ncbi:lipopolysaccharide biosynthesis protein [Salinarimonas soli]|uniref:Lipopolysaccharide biosynthesis protein n=2 Tax=Salinarimonas soli TaxID=1638099 RepID=A0A5B2VCC6_9HYPH|nr:lipopolysaccharide biosynthesis protein [Salinarimonas soli]